jgi:TonB family protein
MFDKLVVSEPAGADFKNRRNYFVISSVVVGVLFATALVVSIYSADIGLGSENLDMAAMLAPVTEADAPRPQKPREPAANQSSPATMPSRQVNQATVDEPTIAPISVSTTRNIYQSRPNFDFHISDKLGDRDPTFTGSGRPEAGAAPGGLSQRTATDLSENTAQAEPPPVKPPPARQPAKTTMISEGVINGKATSLPVPAYPPAAKAVGASGKVDVQVVIDELGKVVSASAVSGNLLLRQAAEKAAWGARFSPTLLSKVPVKVTGVIVYNFTR